MFSMALFALRITKLHFFYSKQQGWKKAVSAKRAVGHHLVQSSVEQRLGVLKRSIRTQQEGQPVAFFSAYKVHSSFNIGPVRFI
jgi:hypothetical protein